MSDDRCEINETVARLSGRTFSAGEVMHAIQVSEAAFTHLVSRVRPTLCSVGSQGRARQFALIDCYQLKLLVELTALTQNAHWSARALNHFLFEGDTTPGLRSPGDTDWWIPPGVKHAVCAEITNAHPLYWTRETKITATWSVIANLASSHINVCTTDRVGGALHHVDKAQVVNATRVLWAVDVRLVKLGERTLA